MGGQKFQYDESGGTFFYFLLSFLALILIPATFYYWPKKEKEDPDEEARKCRCPGCRKKKEYLKKAQPWQGTKKLALKLVIVSGWVLLILLAYKVSQFDYEMANFDPYEILGTPLGASQADIKKAYRKLSVVLHPDKETGNEKEFMKLTKAYQALTDDEARKNWEKYGNPDGPGAMSFGIALPSWIVEKENTIWVLGLYALVFMVALPIVVGTWWYRSIKFSGDKVLLSTTQLYYYFFHKKDCIPLKRIIMILAASMEFDRKHNSEIIERETDQEDIPQLIKKLSNIGEKNKERPLCYPYSLKARAIINAHLLRVELNEPLEQDRRYIIAKCPYLLQEQINCVNQLILLAYARRVHRLPSIETIEYCMKLSPMIVQALFEFKTPILQLPHMQEDFLKYFHSKKRQIKSLQQFAQLKGEERRSILRGLSAEEYDDVMKVLGNMPYVDFQVRCEVMDDENPTEVTAGAIVTVTVTLIRKDMSTLFGDESAVEANAINENGVEEVKEIVNGEENQASQAVKRPAWLKQKKGGGKKSNKEKKKQKHGGGVKHKLEESPAPPSKVRPEEKEKVKPVVEESEDSDISDIEGNDERSSDDEAEPNNVKQQDEDQEWERIQQKLNKREKALEGRSKTSHSVHCPLFPQDKQEYWWAYICDRKSRTLLASPYHVTNLVDREEFQLKFTAPNWKGVFTFTACLRSDSYVGFDQQKDIKLDVKEAPEEIKEHPQWEFGDSDEEGPAEDEARESEYTTDEVEEDD